MKKCPLDSAYTLKEVCPKCGSPTKEAHYKFVKIKSAEERALEKERRNYKAHWQKRGSES